MDYGCHHVIFAKINVMFQGFDLTIALAYKRQPFHTKNWYDFAVSRHRELSSDIYVTMRYSYSTLMPKINGHKGSLSFLCSTFGKTQTLAVEWWFVKIIAAFDECK